MGKGTRRVQQAAPVIARPPGAPERYLLPLPKTSDAGLLLVERIRRWVEVCAEREDFWPYIDRDRRGPAGWSTFSPSGLDGAMLHGLCVLNARDRATVRAAYADPETPGADWVRAAFECLKVYDLNVAQRERAVSERIDARVRLDAYLMDPATLEDHRRLAELELQWTTSRWRIKWMNFRSPGWDRINHVEANDTPVRYVTQLYQAGHPAALALVSRATSSRRGTTRVMATLSDIEVLGSDYEDPTIEAFSRLTVLNPLAPAAVAPRVAKTTKSRPPHA